MADYAATVVVCTHDRAPLLAECLASIEADSSAVDREVLVVDNASSDGTPGVLAAAAAASSRPFRWVREPRLGHANARNRAVAESRGDLLLMTDDDVLVHDGWADALARPFADPAVGAVGGRVLPLWEHPPPPWLAGPLLRLIAMVDFGDEPRPLARNEVPVGANMAVRGALLRETAEPFDARTGHRGRVAMGHEERQFLLRLRDRGVEVGYAPDAVVDHRVDEQRTRREWIRRAAYQSGFGKARAERGDGELPAVPRRLVALARSVPGASRRRRRNDAAGDALTQDDMLAEVRAYQRLGHDVEAVLGWSAALTTRLAARDV